VHFLLSRQWDTMDLANESSRKNSHQSSSQQESYHGRPHGRIMLVPPVISDCDWADGPIDAIRVGGSGHDYPTAY